MSSDNDINDTIEDYLDRQSAEDTVAWDKVYARATRRARRTRYAQLILEFGPSEYKIIDGRNPDALKLQRLRGARIHVILDWM